MLKELDDFFSKIHLKEIKEKTLRETLEYPFKTQIL